MCLSILGSILHDLTDNIYDPIAVVRFHDSVFERLLAREESF